jgi:hypothetical protein
VCLLATKVNGKNNDAARGHSMTHVLQHVKLKSQANEWINGNLEFAVNQLNGFLVVFALSIHGSHAWRC